MEIVNLQIQRIMIHQVFQRDEDGNKIAPVRSSEFIRFDDSAMSTFKSRIYFALGSDSKAVPMSIVSQEATDLPQIIDELSKAGDERYIELSYDVAKKLADAQQKRNIPGGIVVVFSGKYGATPKKFVGIMKAEIYSAYEKSINKLTEEITLKYVEEALLTPATKLYKTAGFFEVGKTDKGEDLNDKWNVLVCDTQISQTDGKAAAQYFYANFLGCGYPKSSARVTKQFYDATCEFLQDLDVTEEKRNDLHNALVSYLKYENTDIIIPTEFSGRYFDEEVQGSYSEYLEDYGLPITSFTKDIQHIESKLKMRKLSFKKNVKVIAPSDVFRDFVEIETINTDESGRPVKWTKIIVKDEIVSQE